MFRDSHDAVCNAQLLIKEVLIFCICGKTVPSFLQL